MKGDTFHVRRFHGQSRRLNEQRAVFKVLAAVKIRYEKLFRRERSPDTLRKEAILRFETYQERIDRIKNYIDFCDWAAKYPRAELPSIYSFALRRP